MQEVPPPQHVQEAPQASHQHWSCDAYLQAPHFLQQFLGKVNLLLEAVDLFTGQCFSKSIVKQVLPDSFRRLVIDGPDSQEVLFKLLSLPN